MQEGMKMQAGYAPESYHRPSELNGNSTERFPVPRLLEMLAKEGEQLLGELAELQERLSPLLAEPRVDKELISPTPPAVSRMGSEILHISNTIYSARTRVKAILSHLDL